jgi:hypothetical protein
MLGGKPWICPQPPYLKKNKLRINAHQLLIPEIKIMFKCCVICVSTHRQCQGDINIYNRKQIIYRGISNRKLKSSFPNAELTVNTVCICVCNLLK